MQYYPNISHYKLRFTHISQFQTANMDRPLHLFSYGGVLFWMISSVIFAVFYAVVMALPVLPCRRWLAPPNQKSFYHYMFFMLLLNIIQVCIPWPHKTSNRVNLAILYILSIFTYTYVCFLLGRGMCNDICSWISWEVNRNVLSESRNIFLRSCIHTDYVL